MCSLPHVANLTSTKGQGGGWEYGDFRARGLSQTNNQCLLFPTYMSYVQV